MEESPCIGIPDFGSVVKTCSDEVGPVGAERRVPYLFVVVQCVEEISCLGVPDFGSVVNASGDDASVVEIEGRVIYGSCVILEVLDVSSCSSFPDFGNAFPA